MERNGVMHYVRGISYDFDGTLAYFEGSHNGLFAIFTRRGIPAPIVQACYADARARGFSLAKLVVALAAHAYRFAQSERKAIQREFEELLAASLHPYPDVACLRTHFEGGCRTAIVTFGDDMLQRQKIRLMKIPFDVCKVAGRHGVKGGYLKTIAAAWGGPIVHVDNDVDELDAIRRLVGSATVYTVHIVRSRKKDSRGATPARHLTIGSLNELAEHFEVTLRNRRVVLAQRAPQERRAL